MQYLRTLLIRCLVYWTLEAGAPSCECAGCDIEFKKLLVYDIDYGWDQSFDVFGSINQRSDIIYESVSIGRFGRKQFRR